MSFYSAMAKMRAIALALAFAGGAACAAYADSDHAQANLDVSIQIKGGCTMDLGAVNNGNIDFGTVNLRNARGHYAGNIYIQCTNDHTVHMTLNTGQNGDNATLSTRRLKLEGETACTDETCIPYAVYQGTDGSRIPWGISGSDVYTVNAARYDDGASGGKGTAAPFWIDVPSTTAKLKTGDYTDQLTITMNY